MQLSGPACPTPTIHDNKQVWFHRGTGRIFSLFVTDLYKKNIYLHKTNNHFPVRKDWILLMEKVLADRDLAER